MTAILVQSYRRRGSVKGPIANLRAIGKRPLFDIDKDVCKLAVSNDIVFGREIGILLATGRISIRSDLLGRRRRAREGNSTADRSFISLRRKLFRTCRRSFTTW